MHAWCGGITKQHTHKKKTAEEMTNAVNEVLQVVSLSPDTLKITL